MKRFCFRRCKGVFVKCTSGAAVSKPFGGVRSFLAVRLGLAIIEGGELSLGGGGVPP